MRLATRTGLASFLSASIVLLAVGGLFRGQFANILQERVDAQMRDRAKTAPILAAVAGRLAESELRTTLEDARVQRGSNTISLGLLPADPLPAQIVRGGRPLGPMATVGGCTRLRSPTFLTRVTRRWSNSSHRSATWMPVRRSCDDGY